MNPPEGSKVSLETERGYDKIVAPQGSGGIMRYLMGAFLLAWLGGWAFGWISAFTSLVSGKESANGFLMFWLAGWTVGGVFAFWMLYVLFRPSLPEQFTLQVPVLRHDSGRPSFTMSFDYRSQMDAWKKMFKRRVITEFSPQNLQTLKIRDFETGNRLTIDKGAQRYELGTALTEIEREWLYRLLAEKYKVEQGVDPNA